MIWSKNELGKQKKEMNNTKWWLAIGKLSTQGTLLKKGLIAAAMAARKGRSTEPIVTYTAPTARSISEIEYI